MPVSLAIFFFKPELFRFVFCLLFYFRMFAFQCGYHFRCLIVHTGVFLVHGCTFRIVMGQYIDFDVAAFEDEVGIFSSCIDAAEIGGICLSGEFKLPVCHLRTVYFHSVVVAADVESLSV